MTRLMIEAREILKGGKTVFEQYENSIGRIQILYFLIAVLLLYGSSRVAYQCMRKDII